MVHGTTVTKIEQMAQFSIANSLHEAQREWFMYHQHYLSTCNLVTPFWLEKPIPERLHSPAEMVGTIYQRSSEQGRSTPVTTIWRKFPFFQGKVFSISAIHVALCDPIEHHIVTVLASTSAPLHTEIQGQTLSSLLRVWRSYTNNKHDWSLVCNFEWKTTMRTTNKH